MVRVSEATFVHALARPFKRDDDLYLACTANLFLSCCFTSGMVIQLCESAAYEDMCKALVGFDSPRGASEFVRLAFGTTRPSVPCSIGVQMVQAGAAGAAGASATN